MQAGPSLCCLHTKVRHFFRTHISFRDHDTTKLLERGDNSVVPSISTFPFYY